MIRRWIWLLSLLAGCGHGTADHVVLEQVRAMPLEFSVQGEGDLRSSKPTPLLVPGSQFTLRQLNWMVPTAASSSKANWSRVSRRSRASRIWPRRGSICSATRWHGRPSRPNWPTNGVNSAST